MRSRINIFVLAFLIFGSACFGQEVVSNDDTEKTEKVTAPSFPYVAQIISDNVNIRSGPGTNYYSCGKLKQDDKIKVVAHQFSWSRIVPPQGCFSWISKQYVEIDPDNQAIGIVTGDNVRIWAGSDYTEPIHCTTLHGKFNKGYQVKLLGEEKGDYYKISPPTGAYFWVSTEYTELLGPVDEVDIAVESESTPKAESPAVVPTKISVEATKLKEYNTLEKQVEAELAKPIATQDYTEMKDKLAQIAENKEAGKAARYSEFVLSQIKRYELAKEVDKAVTLQEAQLYQIKERIEKARIARLGEIEDLGKFAVIGKFQTSNVYSQEKEIKHYRITDDSGGTLCYALPSSQVSKQDLNQFIGKKVGLIGTIKPHLQSAGALVEFAEIVELE